MPLDPHDELGIPWDAFVDGRVHRLVRGRDFARGADAMEEAAANASRRLGRVVRTFAETRWGVVYLWFQFVDYEVVVGEPCPCGSTDLRRVNVRFAECASCKATIALIMPRRKRPTGEDEGEDEPLLGSLFATDGLPRKAELKRLARGRSGAAGPPVPAAAPLRLDAFSEVKLFPSSRSGERERLVGHGLGPAGRPELLVVDYALSDGERIAGPGYPGGWVHTVWSVPVSAFETAIHLDRFEGEPSLAFSEPPPAEQPPGGDEMPLPPSRLADFTELDLARYGRARDKRPLRFRGTGRLPSGELALLSVRLRKDAGEGPPTADDATAEPVRCVPMEPFGAVIDLDALHAEPGEGAEAAAAGAKRAKRAPGLKRQRKTEPEPPATSEPEEIPEPAPVAPAPDPAATSEPEEIPEPAPVAPAPDPALLNFEQVRLFYYGHDRDRQSFYGYGRTHAGTHCLMLVDYPADDSQIVKAVHWIPVEPFGELIDLEVLRARAPSLEIDNPAGPAEGAIGESRDTLAGFRDVHLFLPRNGQNGQRFYGYGRSPAGETALISLRRPPSDPDPAVDWVPLAPFIPVVDLDTLFGSTADLVVDAPDGETAAADRPW